MSHCSTTYTGCVTRARNSHVLIAYRFSYTAASGTSPRLTSAMTNEWLLPSEDPFSPPSEGAVAMPGALAGLGATSRDGADPPM